MQPISLYVCELCTLLGPLGINVVFSVVFLVITLVFWIQSLKFNYFFWVLESELPTKRSRGGRGVRLPSYQSFYGEYMFCVKAYKHSLVVCDILKGM